MSVDTKTILSNKEVIDINQDKLGIQARIISGDVDHGGAIYGGKLSDGYTAILFNTAVNAQTMTFKFSDLGIHGTWKIRDLWKHQDLGEHTDSFTASVGWHDVVHIKLTQ